MIKSRDYLVWVDCEMTGLDPQTNVLIEIAAVITDNDLNVVAEGPDIVIHRSRSLMDAMDRWNRLHHGRSGLTEAVLRSKISQAAAEKKMLKFVRKYCCKGSSPLCGNSIGHDRRFLIRYMPELNNFFHYQNMDVSTIKQLGRRWFPERCNPPAKAEGHRALVDIRESITELRYYRKNLFRRK